MWFGLGILPAAILCATERTQAAGADTADPIAAIIGSPQKIAVEPGGAPLVGRRATSQLIATAFYADGSTRDLTRALEWVSLNPDIAQVSPKGQVTPKGNGEATILAKRANVEGRTTVRVERMEAPRR